MTLSRSIAQTIVKHNIDTKYVIEVLSRYHLLSLLPAVLKAMKQIVLSTSVRHALHIESPFDLKEDAITHIKSLVGKNDIEHTIHINKKLLAGFKATYQGKLYDGSAERIIKQLTN